MDNDLNALHRRALGATGKIIAGITPEQWGEPTPCDGWDARELTNHLVSGNFWAAELAAGKTIDEVGIRLDGDVLGPDPSEAFTRSASAAAAAFEAPGALEAPCAVSYGPVSGEVYIGHRFIDVLIHGWDLAVATGQDRRIDPDLVTACQNIIEPQAEMLRASGAFGQETAPEPGADEQTRLLLRLGRRP